MGCVGFDSTTFNAWIATAIPFLRFGYAVGHAGLLGAGLIILLGHPDWHGAEIAIFAAYPRHQVQERAKDLHETISAGRLLISEKNVTVIATNEDIDFDRLVEDRSSAADLVLMEFTSERIERRGRELFERFPVVRDLLLVSAEEAIGIV
jgi:hypothetical protein